MKSRLNYRSVRIAVFFLFCSLAMSSSVFSQSYEKTDLGVKADIGALEVEVQFFSPSIVRILKWPQGSDFSKESLSVIKSPQSMDLEITETGDELLVSSGVLTAALNLKNGRVVFTTPGGIALLNEKEAGASFIDFDDAGVPTWNVKQSFILDEDEAVYGLGQQQEGRMVQRNLELTMIQGINYTYIPFMHSDKGYGLFWDNYSPTVFSDNKQETYFDSEVGDCIDYYFMYGGNADGVIALMRELTGQVPMFPLWTYGYWQSKERYRGQDETVGVVEKYRELGVPIDGIIQDWQYWDNNYLWNAMEFLHPEFYDPQQFVDGVHALNARMIITIWSSFGPKTKQYRELNEKDMLFDFKTWPESGSRKWPPNMDYPSGVRVYDAYHPEARDLYWRYLYEGLFSLGIDGWWMDSTEPDHFHPEPSDFDNQTYLGSFRRVRNAYPLMTVGGVYKGQRAVTSDKRVFILTRSAFAGQQRYGANSWSGDVIASWEALRNQISGGLNFSLTGIPYWNSDIGGFFLWNFEDPLEDADYRELYTRWVQFGAFCPMMRSHGTDAPREIYRFGKKGEPFYDSIEKFINLRYLLLPYIYSTSWDVTANQSSMMRALVMDFADDRDALDLNDQFMFGKSILVCPVTDGMYSRDREEDFSTIGERELYLPRGADWFDFWTGEKFTGGQTITRETPIDIMPLYIRTGSILPIGPKVQYAEEKNWETLEIRIYEGADGEFVLYEDENDNYNYEQGMYSTITFTWNDEENSLAISNRSGSFPGMLTDRTFNIVMVSEGNGRGMDPSQTDREITYTGERIEVSLR
jgi:alpha-D-xyloside xylohydrolase